MKFVLRAFFLTYLITTCWTVITAGQDSAAVKKDSTTVAPRKDSPVVRKPRVPVTAIANPDSVRLDSIINYAVSKKPDSLGKPDPLIRFRKDSVSSVYGYWTGGYIVKHPTYHASAKSVLMVALERSPDNTDWIFYTFAGLLLYLAFLRLAFPKYFSDLARVFFNTALRQKQIREQLIQEPLPALLLNVFFVITGGLFSYFLFNHYGLLKKFSNHWIVLGFFVGALLVIYLFKYLFIRFLGWIVGRREEAETYNFVVFMVNKFAGFVLLPTALLLALTESGFSKTVLFFSYLILSVLLLYRWGRSFQLVHKGLRINQIQMLVFVISFEIIPILVLYKVLFNLFG